MFNVKPIVQRLKSYREERGIKQTDLAQRLGTSPATLSRWENGRANFNPTLSQLLIMADMLGITLMELLSQENASSSAAPEKAPKRTGKTTKSKSAVNISAKAASAKSSKARSAGASKAKTKKSMQTTKTKASAAAAVSKGIKTKKAGSTEEAVKKSRKTPLKAAKASLTPTAAPAANESPKKKPGRPRKTAAGSKAK